MRTITDSRVILTLVGVFLTGRAALVDEAFAAQVSGELRQWHRVELVFTGPSHNEADDNPNPFLDYRLQCTLSGPSGQSYEVPGFFDTNGSGGTSGDKWKCRFAPDQAGAWQYSASFRQGSNAAVSLSANAGSATSFNGDSGTFNVAASNKSGRDFRAPDHGTLVNFGSHYLQFRGSGKRWIKGAADVPENFFGYTGFDNTPNAGHDFDAHVQDWSNGDPNWNNGAGKAIIGALNYLASTGANGFYFLPMNIGGDGNDTFPTIGSQNKTHYDTSKLLQWETVLSHADKLGIFAHFQLAETESGNENYHDNGELGNQRKLYYRELIARFGHHLGIEWDLGEENDYGTSKRVAFADYIKAVDPYDHPVTTHIHTNQMESFYGPLLGNGDFDMTAFQITEGGLNNGGAVEEWRNRSAAAGVPLVVSIDEPQTIHNDPNDAVNGYPNGREDFLWPIYMSGGGGFEWYVQQDGGGHSFDQQVDNWRLMSTALTWTGHALDFMHSMPFWEMTPNKSLGSSTGGGTTYVLAKPGEVYALYNDNGGNFSLNLSGQSGQFEVTWFHPRNGTWHGGGSVSGGSNVNLGSAPFGDDAAVVVKRPAEPCANDAACADSNPCTNDTCVSGVCQNTPNGSACNDGIACTNGDVCSGGTCAGIDVCAAGESCNLSTGICEGAPPPPTNFAFTPIEDAYVEGSSGQNNSYLKVEPNNRTTYLKFEVNDVFGGVSEARLILRQSGDSSGGISIEVREANSNGWSEQTLNASNAPSAGSLLATHSGPVPGGTTLVFDLGPAAVPGSGVYSFVVTSPSGNDAWFGSRESGAGPSLEIDAAERPPMTELCEPASILSSGEQTRTLKAKFPTNPGKGKISVTGTLRQAAEGDARPDLEAVTLRMTDGAGVYYQASIPAGSIEALKDGKKYSFKDRSPFEFGGLKQVKFVVGNDPLAMKFKLKAQEITPPYFVGTSATVTMKIGDTCYLDPSDACTTNRSGTSVKCR